jgi:hypothetical protein
MRVLRFLFGNWYSWLAVLVALVLWIGGKKGNLADV